MYNNVIQSPQPRFGQYLLHFLKLASPIFQIVVLDMGSETCEIQVQYISNCIIQDYKGRRINECIVRYSYFILHYLITVCFQNHSSQYMSLLSIPRLFLTYVLHLNNIILLQIKAVLDCLNDCNFHFVVALFYFTVTHLGTYYLVSLLHSF